MIAPIGKAAPLVTRVARDVEASRLVVDMGDPQVFAGRVAIGDAAGEELASAL